MASSEFPTFKVLGTEVNQVGVTKIVDTFEKWIAARAGKCHFVVVTGFHGIWESCRDPEFGEILKDSDLFCPDGIAAVWLSRIRGRGLKRRASGAEIMVEFFERANERGFRSFFYGDTDETLAELKEKLSNKYPGHIVAGTYSPPFRKLTEQEDAEIIEMINAANPDIVWVGLGLPKQERWIHAHQDQLNAPIAAGVGAAFGFLSERVKRCPPWLGQIGLEWLYRLIQEPRKLWRRDMIDGPRFLFHVFLETLGLKKY